jgi:hypothetical protein
MANTIKTYFLVPNWDIPARSVPLGSVITNRAAPQRSLARCDPQAYNCEVQQSFKENFRSTLDHGKTNQVGLWAQFLQLCGLGGEASLSLDKGTIQEYGFKHMTTESFTPSREFVKAIVGTPEVADYLEQWDYRKSVYIITGIKIVEDATITTTKRRTRGVHLNAGVDATSVGLPISIGPQANHEISNSEHVSFENSSPIIFAFEICQVRQNTRKQEPSSKLYNKGALFSLDNEEEKLETEILEGCNDIEDGFTIVPSFDEEGQFCNCVLSNALLINV